MDKFKKLREKVKADIELTGLSVISVFGDKDNPPFAYSVGLFKTYAHPEIIVFGIEVKTAHAVINDIALMIKAGQRFLDGFVTDKLLQNFNCTFVTVPKQNYGSYTNVAKDYYQGFGFPLLQLIWPDPKGLFPWQEGYGEIFKKAQPVLGKLH